MSIDVAVRLVSSRKLAAVRRAWWRCIRGAYDRMKETHDAIHAWREANNRAFAGYSWEIYADWSDDPSKLKTTIMYLLK